MFDEWRADLAGYRVLIPVDRPVTVATARLFPPADAWAHQLPMWVKAGGLKLEPLMAGRQTAWLRRADGGWLAAVTVAVASGNGRSTMDMPLWVLPEDISAPPQPGR